MHWPLVILVAGGSVYLLIALVAAWHYLGTRREPDQDQQPDAAPISILKPLAGADLDLESNLRTFFEQPYPHFEILFAVADANDPAVPIVRRLQFEYAQIETRLLIVGEPPYPNRKVWSLDHLVQAAQYEIVAMSDSDIRVDRHFLAAVNREFADEYVDLTTCPYRAVAGPSLWSRLEAVGLNTEFIAGLLVARLLEGVHFAVGPTIVARKRVLAAIGGFDRLKDYLAEDFVMGQLAAGMGFGVALSPYVIEHHIGAEDRAKNFRHRLRWNRSTRRSRPAGYVGQVFINPLPFAFLLLLAAPAWWPLATACLVLRFIAAFTMHHAVLEDRRLLSIPHLLVQDLLSLAFWIAGFVGNTIDWRGRQYRLNKDGTFTPCDEPSA
ncbi:MAG: bacteriohopanetetrol glucosamine biosynthesis glycosyltransferase HpnI [Bryobacteraceae bacterium]|nr:bacteriohopanetetrol glucosamine biosynthesis glycosyltransferase HpnI [Bryobacteraceae bacterium]